MMRHTLMLAAASVCLLGVPGPPPGIRAEPQTPTQAPTTWRLVEVRFFPGDRAAQFQSLRKPDARGGELRVQIPGTEYQLCPDGKETLRFTWTFTRPVNRISSGDRINVGMQYLPESQSGSCTGQLGARSHGGAVGADGAGNPFSAQDSQAIDTGFTHTAANVFVVANPRVAGHGSCCVTGAVNVAPSSYVPSRPRTWFSINVNTPAGTNMIVYLYQVVPRRGR